MLAMEKDGELNVLDDILARDGDLDTMETEDVDNSNTIDMLQADSTQISFRKSKSAVVCANKHLSAGDEKLRQLAEERLRLEKENAEKKRQLEELRKQEQMIEEAATKRDDGDENDSLMNKDVDSDLFSSYETLSEESGSSDDSDSEKDNVDQSSASGQSERHCTGNSKAKDVGKKHRVTISPVRWKKEDELDSKSLKPKTESSSARSQDHHSSSHSRSRISTRMEKLYKYIFLDAKYFLIKSGNHENVSLSQSKGVWSTPPQNEARLNQAFRTCSNVILIFSVKESGRFQGFARIAAESDRNHPPVRWVLPPGLTAKTLSGVFKLDWINRNELDFIHTGRLNNTWNENQPIRVGRDGQAIEPIAAEALCRLFPIDRKIDLHAIALKSREAMDSRKLDPHELYKKQETARRQAKMEQRKLRAKHAAEAKRQQYRSKADDPRRLERLRMVQTVASTIGFYNEFRRGYPARPSADYREFGGPMRRVSSSPTRRDLYAFDRPPRAKGPSPYGYRERPHVGRPFLRGHSRERNRDDDIVRRPAGRFGRQDVSRQRGYARRR